MQLNRWNNSQRRWDDPKIIPKSNWRYQCQSRVLALTSTGVGIAMLGNATIYGIVRTPDVGEVTLSVASLVCGLIILVRPAYQRLYEEVLWLSCGVWAATAIDLFLDNPTNSIAGRIRGGVVYFALTLITFALYFAEYGYRTRKNRHE